MTVPEDDLTTAIIDTVRKHALGPDYRRTATAYPLSAYGSSAGPDDFYNTTAHKVTARWDGRPVITVRQMEKYGGDDWTASVYVDGKGKATVLVPKGTKVIEVERK